MWKTIKEREFGIIRPNLFRSFICKSRVSSIDLSNHKEIVSSHRGSINSLQIDLTEGRYLLAGSADATVAVYDIQCATDHEAGGLIAKHRSLFVIGRQHEHGHEFAVSSAIWYPVDTGLFVTGSYDRNVNVWDTNTNQMVMNFKMPGKVYRTAMSSIAKSHMLIATGTEDAEVRLCDIASGASTHTLSGHLDGVMSLDWSTSCEWVLVSGSCDGAIRFWDIRRAGCFRVLDQMRTQLGRRPPLLAHPKAGRVYDLSCLFCAEVFFFNEKKLNVSTSTPRATVSASAQVKVTKRKSHPGMLSVHDRSTGHYGVVTGLKMTEDGMYLLSAGSDSRLRMWDMDSGCNTLVNYGAIRFPSRKPIQMAVTEDSSFVFVPCLAGISQSFDVSSGKTVRSFRGHYDCVNCCCYNAQDQASRGNDREILVWTP
ncbi:hypothetical protein M569_06428, partial [Genlisea aurea]